MTQHTIPLDEYLGILRGADADEHHPFVGLDELTPLVDPFVRFSHALADLVDAARLLPDGYAGAVDLVEQMVHALPPVPKDTPDEEALAEFLRQLSRAPEAEEPTHG